MKIRLLLILNTIIWLPTPNFALANEVLNNQDDVVTDYTVRSNKNYEPIFSIKKDSVRIEIIDLNGDGSEDLVLYDKNRCGSKTGCREDVYFCTIKEPNCKGGKYCFAGSLYEGQLKKKGKSLTCK